MSMNGNNAYVTNQGVQSRTQIAAVFPKPKPCPQQQPTIVVVPEQQPLKRCCPVLSRGCDLCSNMCGDYYMNPICNSVGITGMLNARPCIVYDEMWGGAGSCIGCQKDCGDANFCPYQGYNRNGIYNNGQGYGQGYGQAPSYGN